jgi:hypothetical protein
MIHFVPAARFLRVTDCDFTNINGENAILGFDANDLTIDGNTFTNVFEGIHITSDGANTGNDIVITDNDFTGIARMAIELQGSVRSAALRRAPG